MDNMRHWSEESLPFVMTISEIAKLLGVGKNTTYDLVKKGALSSVRVGRQIRVSRDAVLHYLGMKSLN